MNPIGCIVRASPTIPPDELSRLTTVLAIKESPGVLVKLRQPGGAITPRVRPEPETSEPQGKLRWNGRRRFLWLGAQRYGYRRAAFYRRKALEPAKSRKA